jgi:hypothetical protein
MSPTRVSARFHRDSNSGEGEPIKIGVTADTEDEVRKRYLDAITAWRYNLSQRETQVGHTRI